VPPEKVGTKFEVAPAVIGEGEAVNEEMLGAATTITVVEEVAVSPAAFVTVRV
jgi:hypothetical protein